MPTAVKAQIRCRRTLAVDFTAPPARDAVLSACGRYRYWLIRAWDPAVRPAAFVMLNPSTADHKADDPTVRKCVGFARRWGCGGVEVVNLFAWRSTDPAGLLAAADPVGPENDAAIRECLEQCSPVVAAWGVNVPKAHAGRVAAVRGLMERVGTEVRCLRLTAGGFPGHPLLVKYATDLIPYTPSGDRREVETHEAPGDDPR